MTNSIKRNDIRTNRIAMNTAFLYVRMLVVLLVTLFISRQVLNTLGVQDYGIYNVVAGLVTMMGFINNSMTVATQRFLSYDIGTKDTSRLIEVFQSSILIHAIIAITVFIVAETIGLWFLESRMNIPKDRISATILVYHLSVLTFVVNVITVPHFAILIAYERMNVFAFISVLEVFVKLIFVLLIDKINYDSLSMYAMAMFVSALIVRLIYVLYALKNFSAARFRFQLNSQLFRKMFSFAGWSLFGGAASMLQNQGINVILNVFFGPSVNAARGLSFQINTAVNGFVQNFQIALNPQIIKSCAQQEFEYMHRLIFNGSRISYYLLFILSMPLFLETEYILGLWLKQVPPYTVIFTQLILLNIVIDSLSGTLMIAAQASGKIKLYQGVVGGLLLMNLPVSYLLLQKVEEPEIVFYVAVFFSFLALFIRLMILQKLINLNTVRYLKLVVLRVTLFSVLAIIFPLCVKNLVDFNSFVRVISVVIASLLSGLVFVYIVGLDNDDRRSIKERIGNRLSAIR